MDALCTVVGAMGYPRVDLIEVGSTAWAILATLPWTEVYSEPSGVRALGSLGMFGQVWPMGQDAEPAVIIVHAGKATGRLEIDSVTKLTCSAPDCYLKSAPYAP